MTIHEIKSPIPVHTPHGKGKALFLYDYSPDTNTVLVIRLDASGKMKHYSSEDILIYPNPMLGEPPLIIPESWIKG